jgi:hypothetical protein
LFDPVGGGDMFIWMISCLPRNCTVFISLVITILS